MHIRLALALAALGFSLPIPLAAQVRLPLAPGQRVRVTAPSASMRNEVATIEAITADTLVLVRMWAGQSLRSAVPLASVQGMDMSRRRRGHAGVGAALGGMLGFIAGTIADRQCERTCGIICICLYRPVGAVVGLGLGAICGAGWKTDLWEPVPLDRLRVGLSPQPSGRLGLGAAVSF
jgi:hypothetical protein